MATRMERFDEFKKLAEDNIVERRDASNVYATLALATAVVRVGDLFAELVEMVKDDDRIVKLLLALAGKQFDRNIAELKEMIKPLPCNEMGGGSSGLDTADDFAMHCDKPDRHDGPHSYEEDDDANQ